jgi:prolyl oligopeptidase
MKLRFYAQGVLAFATGCAAVAPSPSRPDPAAAPPARDAAAADSARSDALPRVAYPATQARPVTETKFGVSFTDDYRWLEDVKAPDAVTWGHAQDAFARARLAALPDREAIASRLRELFYVESVSAPRKEGKRYFFMKRAAQQEKSVYYARDSKAGEARALLDPNAWSTDGSVALRAATPSHDGRWVAYLKSEHNSDEAVLHVLDAATGRDTPRDVIEGAKYAGVTWTPGGDGFYYTWIPPVDGKTVTTSERPGFAEVRFHRLGDDPRTDALVHARTGDARTFAASELSRDGHWLLYYVQHGWTSTDIFYRDARKPLTEPFKPLVTGKAFKYDVSIFRDRFYVKTDDGAPAGRVFEVDPAHPERERWREIVPERKDATLEDAAIIGGHLSLAYLKDVTSRLELRDLGGKLVREIPLPALGSASNLVGSEDDDEAYFSFTSFTYPTEIYETSVKTGLSALHYRLAAPVDPSRFTLEQRFAASKDGARVPYFLVTRAGFKADASAPTLLYAYGGFNASQKPGFTSSAYPWLERGGAYVVANLRGGGEYGEAWHQGGMRTRKQNVFDDLYAVAEALIRDRVTTAGKLVVRGASNGGLLVAAAITQRPELFRVGLCGVPLVDMLRYPLYGSGKTWVEEYGSPDDEADFRAIAAYSPYQHAVAGTRYPSLLVLSADSDDRVDPMHAWKFAALMQARSAGGPVLLRIEKNSGHGGADLVKASVEKVADELAFALDEVRTNTN